MAEASDPHESSNERKNVLVSMPRKFGAWAELHRTHLENDKRFLGMLRQHGGKVSLSSIFQVAAKIGLEWMDAEYGSHRSDDPERDSAHADD